MRKKLFRGNRSLAIIVSAAMLLSTLFSMSMFASAETAPVDLTDPSTYTSTTGWQASPGLEAIQANGEVKITNTAALSATNLGAYIHVNVDLDQTPIFYYTVDSDMEACIELTGVGTGKKAEVWNTGSSAFIDKNDGTGIPSGSVEINFAEATGLTGKQTIEVGIWLSFWGTSAVTNPGEKHLTFSEVGFKAGEQAPGQGTEEDSNSVDLTTPGAYTPTIDWQDQQGLDVTQENGEVKISNTGALSATNAGTFVQVTVNLDETPIFYYDVKESNLESYFGLTIGDKKVDVWNTGGQWFVDNNTGEGIAHGSDEVDLAEKTGLTGEQTITFEVWLSFWGTGAATTANEKYLTFSEIGFKAGEQAPDQGGENPDQGGENPDQGGENPDQGGENPDQGGENPDQGGENPDQGGELEVIDTPTRLLTENLLYDPNLFDVTPSEDGYGYTASIHSGADTWGGSVEYEITVDLDKVPYLYVDLGRTEVWWNLKVAKPVEKEGELVWEECAPNTSWMNLNGAKGLTRFNMADVTGLTGEQKIRIRIYLQNTLADLTPDAANTINGVYIDGEEFSFDAATPIEKPVVLNPEEFTYSKEELKLELKGDNGYTMKLQPLVASNRQYACMGLTIDFDKVHNLCFDISEIDGQIGLYVEDITDLTDFSVHYYSAPEDAEVPGTVVFDLLTDESGSVNFSGVRTIMLGVFYQGDTRGSVTIENMYLTDDQLTLPEGLGNNNSDGDDDSDSTDDDDTDNDNANNDNDNTDNEGSADSDDNTPETGVADVALPMLLLMMAMVAAIVVNAKRKVR